MIMNQTQASKSLTLSPQSCEWMKQKRPIYRSFARLAKFWTQTVRFDRVVCGKSYIFEVLASKAVLDHGGTKRAGGIPFSFVAALREFFNLVANLDNLEVFFNHSDGAWYADAEIPREIRQQSPILMDPVNPFHNLLDFGDDEDGKEEFFRVFIEAARESRRILQPAIDRSSGFSSSRSIRGGDGHMVDDATSILQTLFQPQPLMHEREEHPLLLQEISVSGKTSFPPLIAEMKLKKLNVADFEQKHYKQFMGALLLNSASIVAVAAWKQQERGGRADGGGNPLQAAVQELKEFFQDSLDRVKTPSIKKDCVFDIPIGNENYISVSMNLKKKRHVVEKLKNDHMRRMI